MKKLSQMIRPALDKDEVLRGARAKDALRCWPEVVGELLAARSHPDRYRNGVVWVAVEGSAWAQELRFQKALILERLRERSADPTLFQDIRFGVRKLPEPEAPPAPESDWNREELMQLSIQEIAARRRAKMEARKHK